MRKALLSFLLVLGLAGPAAPADGDWLPVRETSLEMRPGSPLDFSAFLANPPIGEESRITVDAKGRLAAANAPDQPVRLLCASLAWSPASGGFPDHATADRYAAQLRMHGYNIARFHYVDAALMFGRGKDFDFDPEVLDRVHYLMAALKRNGIYWIVDGLTSPRGAFGGHDDRWDLAGDLKLGVQIDDGDFRHWERFQALFLARPNPYTGIAPIRDPALVAIVPMNENGIEFDAMLQEQARGAAYSPRLQPLFSGWLKKRYGTDEALARHWGRLRRGESLENGTVALPARRGETGARMRDFQRFLIAVEEASTARMTETLRGLGFRGLILPYNNWPTLQTDLSRRGQQAVAMNTYHDWVGSYAPGAAIQATSSLEDGLLYLRTVAASRWLGRPFVVTEYDHLFWNPYRYEAGLAAPAFAALQGWDALCRHGHGPIVLAYGEDVPHKRAMLPYAIALDPVARAGETLAALLYRRGDVAASPFAVPFLIDGETGLTGNAADREPERLTRLALLAAIGLAEAGGPQGAEPAVAAGRGTATPEAVAGALAAGGRIAPGFARDFGRGRVDSATGEMRLDAGNKRLTLHTARSEAAAFARLDGPLPLGQATLTSASGGGLFALSSLDGAPVGESRRLLVILASDARNSGMRFSDYRERVIADFGHLPVLIRRMEVAFSLAGGGEWRLSPVGLDGAVRAAEATRHSAGNIRVLNDAPGGPTTYFLLERL